MRMLDHDLATLQAFTVFGADPPLCFLLYQKAAKSNEELPISTLLRMVLMSEPNSFTGRLTVDFARHVMPAYKAVVESNVPSWQLDVAQRYWEGDQEVSSADLDSAASICRDLARRTGTDTSAVLYSDAVEADKHARAHNAAWATVHAVQAANDNDILVRRRATAQKLSSTLYEAVETVADLGYYARTEPRRLDETQWQFEHTLKAVKAFQEGRPWPKVPELKKP
jgi:hypothetical protein